MTDIHDKLILFLQNKKHQGKMWYSGYRDTNERASNSWRPQGNYDVTRHHNEHQSIEDAIEVSASTARRLVSPETLQMLPLCNVGQCCCFRTSMQRALGPIRRVRDLEKGDRNTCACVFAELTNPSIHRDRPLSPFVTSRWHRQSHTI